MGFTRKFASRVDSDNKLADGEEGGEEIPTLSARIEEKQKRTSNNSKVYPKGHPIEIAEHEKQHTLQTKICIVLCTVLPFLTLVATIHRLWFMGVIELSNWEVTDCPDHWILWSGSCYFYMPEAQPWEEAKETCARLDNSYLVYITSDEENKFLEKMTVARIWIGGRYSSKGWRWEPGNWGINKHKIETIKQKTPRHRKDIFVVKDTNSSAGENETARVEETENLITLLLSTATTSITPSASSRTTDSSASSGFAMSSVMTSETSTATSVEQQSSSQLFTASTFGDFSTALFKDALTASVSPASTLINRVAASSQAVSSAALPQAVSSTASSQAVSSTASSQAVSSTVSPQAVSSTASPLLLRSSSSLLLSSLKPSPIPPINQTVSMQIIKSGVNSSQESLRRKKSRLKEDQNINIINVTANGKFVNGTILRKMKSSASSHRHLDIDECLVYHRGSWYRDECNKPRGFICKISVPDGIQMEKTTCRNKYKVNVYNRDLYYVCKDED